ncbi:MAG: glycosyltransferase [Acidimicrobiales bacterium]
MVDVGVVVVTYNSRDHLDRLLASLDDGLEGLAARVVVVDNSSSDDTVSRLRSDARLEVVALTTNGGYAAGINEGLDRLGDADSVLVLNPDIDLSRGSVRTLLRTAEQPSVGIVVPQIRSTSGRLKLSLRRDPSVTRALGVAVLGDRLASRFSSLSETVGDTRAYLVRRDVDWSTGAAMLITRSCVDAVGRWDESFFLYSEETDFADRARRLGFRVVYEPAAVVRHGDSGGMASPRLRSMLVVNRVRYFRRRHRRLPSAAFYGAVLLNELTRSAVGNVAARAAAVALIRPSRRPVELDSSAHLLPS